MPRQKCKRRRAECVAYILRIQSVIGPPHLLDPADMRMKTGAPNVDNENDKYFDIVNREWREEREDADT